MALAADWRDEKTAGRVPVLKYGRERKAVAIRSLSAVYALAMTFLLITSIIYSVGPGICIPILNSNQTPLVPLCRHLRTMNRLRSRTAPRLS